MSSDERIARRADPIRLQAALGRQELEGVTSVTLSHATATLHRDGRSFDVAVPVGTTLSGLLAQLGPQAGGAALVVDELGRPVDGTEVFGDSIPSGASLFVRSSDPVTDAVERSAARERQRSFDVAGASVFGGCVLLAPVLALAPEPAPVATRAGLAAVLLLFTLAMTLTPAARSRWNLLAAPAGPAAAAAVLLPHEPLVAGWSFALAFIWAGALGALAISTHRSAESLDAATTLWFAPALCLSAASIGRLPDGSFAPFALAAGAVLLAVGPSAAVRVPDHQLLNLPAVLSTAPSVHAPEARPPARVTGPRVRRTLRLGAALRTVLILIAAAAVVVGAPTVVAAVAFDSFEGWGSLVLLVLVLGFFALQPRSARPASARWLPRAAVVLVLAVAVWSPPPGLTAWWLLGAVALAMAIVGFGVWMRRGMYAPLLTRLGDIAERVALALVVPAAIVAAGGVSMLRAVP
ncbi:MAG: hypothetical protein Q4E05_03590 [Pseudoclavibacter sp.]|nr:hypothetical protein [Pseudoclavibacter sp.]